MVVYYYIVYTFFTTFFCSTVCMTFFPGLINFVGNETITVWKFPRSDHSSPYLLITIITGVGCLPKEYTSKGML